MYDTRASGIDFIGNIPWGTHFCQFYQAQDDLIEIVAPYFKAGLENSEFCIWILPQSLNVKSAKEVLNKFVPRIETYLEKGQMEIISYEDWNSEVNSNLQKSFELLTEKVNCTLGNGYEGLRLTEEAFWQKENPDNSVDYEESLNFITGKLPVIILHTCSLEKYSAIDTIEIAANHDYVLAKKKGEWKLIGNPQQKNTENLEQMEKALEILRLNEDQFRAVIQNVKSGIALIDETGRFAVVNPAFMQMFGLDKKLDILNVNSQDWSLWEVYGEDLKLLHVDEHPVRKAVLTEKPVKDQLVAVKNPGADELTWMLVSAEPVVKEDGQIYRVICTYHDITEQRQDKEALIEANEELQIQSEELQAANEELQVQTEEIKAQTEEITEAYQELSQSEEKYRKLFENMQEGFFIADIITDEAGTPVDYKIIEANQAFKAQTGVSREELLGKTAYGMYPDLDSFWAETYGSVALTGEPAHFENYADPFGRYYEVFAYQIWPGRFAAIFLDITKRRQAELKLRESQERFLIAKEAADLGIHEYDVASGIIQWDKRVREIWGIEPGEPITYDTFMAGLHPEDRALTQEAVDKSLDPAGSGKYYAEYRVISRKDGRERWVAATGHTIFEEGRALRLTGTVQDITEQKKTEEALRESQARLETIFTAIPDAIIEYDINGQPVRANEAALKAYGLVPSNLTRDKALTKLKIAHMDNSPVKLEELPTSRALKGEIIEGELYRFTNAEGKELIITTYAAPLFKDSKVNGAVALWHDITELKRAEEEVQESEKLYRAIARNFPNGMVYAFDRNLRFLVADGEALENIGWSKDKIEGKFVYELDEETRRLIEPRYRNVLAGQSLSFETVYRERIFLSQYVPIRNDTGEISAGLVVGLDITELKEIEAALKRNEKRLNDLLNSIQDGFLELDQEWRFTYINKRAANNGNFQPEELIGQNIWEKFPYMVGTEFETVYREVMNTRVPEHFEIKSLVLNKWYEVSVYPSTAGISVFWRDVSERKHIEEALRKSESDLRKAQEIARVGNWEWDLETNLVTGSEEMYRIFGLSPDPATFFQQYIDLLVPEDRERVLGALNGTINGNAPYDIDYQVVLNNGSKRFIHAEAVTIYDNCKPVKVIGTAHDITERKTVEMELLHQRELLQQTFDNIPVLLVIWDPNLERFTLNRYAEQVLGWTTAEANSGDFMAKIYPDPAYRSRVSDYMLSLESGWRELIGTSKGGERIPIEWANIFLTDNTMVGIGVDLRERKKAEAKIKETLDNLENLVKIRTAELENAYNSLKESEEGLSEAQKMAHLGNWNLDLTTYELYWSDEVYRIFGLDAQQSGMDFTKFLEYVHPEDRTDISNTFTKVLYENPCEMDYRITSASGKERILHSHCEVIFDKENIPVRIKGTVQDVTERKKAEDALAKIDKARIKEIHHRIKNNLQVISSLLDLQAETFSHLEVCKAPEVIKAFKESQSRIASMALIHEELYEGKESGNLDFAAYLRKLTAYLLNLYNLKTAGIDLKLDFEDIFLDMDTAIPLGIIVNELVSNSLKHAFPHGKQKEIRIILQKKENFNADRANSEPGTSFGDNCEEYTFTYALTVADNGKGIPEEIDLQNAETLGLQLVNILVEQIDGCIELKRSKGTEFTIWFNNTQI